MYSHTCGKITPVLFFFFSLFYIWYDPLYIIFFIWLSTHSSPPISSASLAHLNLFNLLLSLTNGFLTPALPQYPILWSSCLMVTSLDEGAAKLSLIGPPF